MRRKFRQAAQTGRPVPRSTQPNRTRGRPRNVTGRFLRFCAQSAAGQHRPSRDGIV